MKPILITAMLLLGATAQAVTGISDPSGMLVVDLPADGHTDVSSRLQAIISNNPNRTIYIPEGTYLLNKPVRTSAMTGSTVAIQLADKAVLKAGPYWNSDLPMITLGTAWEANTTAEKGYFYYIDGGTIDGSGVAACLAVECGRNIQVRNLNLIDTPLGFEIKNGTNGGSSDADIFNLNIVGNGKAGSIGFRNKGYDNTFSNITISNCQTGLEVNGGGVIVRDFTFNLNNESLAEGSVAIKDTAGDNWYVNINVTDYARAFHFGWYNRPVVDNTTVNWTSSKGNFHDVFFCEKGGFSAVVRNLVVKLNGGNAAQSNRIISEKNHDGTGSIANLIIDDESLVSNVDHKKYIFQPHPMYLEMARPHGKSCTHAASVNFPGKVVIAKLAADGTTDVAADLQKIIDANPGCTIYIPDGNYFLGKTVRTSSEPGKNVALRLGNFAYFSPKATFTGKHLFDLGSKGGVYGVAPTYFEGGTLHGDNRVDAMKITSGRNSVIRYTVILKSDATGMFIGEKADGTEVCGVNIEGNYSTNCIGVIVEGPNSEFNMMRINDVHHGMLFRSSGNIARNIHPLTYNRKTTWEGCCGVIDEVGGNYYDYYYPDHFSIGFYLEKGRSLLNNCFCYNYTPVTGGDYSRIIVRTDGPFDSYVGNMRADFGNPADYNTMLVAGEDGGPGLFFNTYFNSPQNLSDYAHSDYDGTEAGDYETPYAGAVPQIGQKYYLYNVESGLFIDANSVLRDEWSTKAVLSPVGIDFELRKPDGIKGVEIHGGFGNLGSINTQWGAMLMDVTADDASRTDFSLGRIRNNDGKNLYTIRVLAANNAGCGVEKDGYLNAGGTDNDSFSRRMELASNAVNGTWQFVTREERLAVMQAEAKMYAGGVDASWLIPGRGMNDKDQRIDNFWEGDSEWGGISGYNGWRVMEWWNTPVIDRRITLEGLPAGTYEYYIEGYNRDGNVWVTGNTAGPYENLGWYYAGANGRQALNVFEDSRPAMETGWEDQVNGLWFPTGSIRAANAFHKGGYVNSPVAANVGADGKLTLGVCKYAGIEEDSFVLGRMYMRYKASTAAVDLNAVKRWAQAAVADASTLMSDSKVSALVAEINGYINNLASTRFNNLAKAVYALKTRVNDLNTGGIDGIVADEDAPGENIIYNLQGIRLDSADAPGIYIINGRKVVVR